MSDWSLQSCLVLASFLLVASFIFKILSASRSPLHALPGPKRASLVLGNVAQAAAFSTSERNYLEEWTDTYGSVVRVHGLLGTRPELCVSDPEFLHRVFISDDDLWPRPGMLMYFVTLIFGPGLLVAHGDNHKRQRKMLNPMFSVAHMRAITPSMYDVARKLAQKISEVIAFGGASSATVDAVKLASATALDIIGSAGLGHDFDALGTEGVYAQAIKQFTPTIGEIQLTIPFLKPLSYLGPYSFRSWVMATISPLLGAFGRSISNFRHILRTMNNTSRWVYRDRQAFIANEAATAEPAQFTKTDVLSNLVRATSMDSSMALDEAEAVAQINTLIFAGHETTSNSITHVLEILSAQKDLQDRLRAEILRARVDAGTTDDLPYDIIMALPLLDATVREVLRLYPPVPMIARESTIDAVVPFSQPVKSPGGSAEITEILVPMNTMVHVSIAGMNRSRAIWGEDAKEFKPERWLRPEGPVDSTSASPFSRIPGVFSSIMTFSAGPKGCLGWRMAVLEIKLVLVVVLERFMLESRNEQKIKWMYGATSFPVVVGEEGKGAQLPLLVSEVTV